MSLVTIAFIIWLIFINLLCFGLMFFDKKMAQKGAYRIPERMFFTYATIGGSIGSILGMQIFRHKTKHWYFVVGMPAILILQIAFFVIMFILTSR